MVASREMAVPIPRKRPIEEITEEDDIKPIRNPAISKIKPLVTTAGRLSSRVPMTDFFLSRICFLKSR